jgi:hypothetical protein
MELSVLAQLAARDKKSTAKVIKMMVEQMEESNRGIEHINGQLQKMSEFMQGIVKQKNDDKVEFQKQIASLNNELDVLKSWNEPDDGPVALDTDPLDEHLVMEEIPVKLSRENHRPTISLKTEKDSN